MSDVAVLLRKLGEVAARPADDGLSLPPDLYTNSAVLEAERAAIFRRDWLCVGRADKISQAGDYFTTQVDTVPLLLVRQDDGGIRAFANVCQHRLAAVAEGCGNASSFSCPYHGWTYDIDGRLVTAPRMPRTFDPRARRLAESRCEVWNGFIYISLDPSAPALAPQLSELAKVLAPYRMGDMRTVTEGREVWNTNWKILTENFLEAYHLNATHSTTLLPIAPSRNVRMTEGSAAYHFYEHRLADTVTPVPFDPIHGIVNPDLTDDVRQTAWVGGVFPSHVFSVVWDWVFWLSLQPQGTDQVIVEHGVAAPLRFDRHAPLLYDHPNLYFLPLITRVNAEDRARVEAVQVGARSGWGRQSALHPHEATLSTFARYLYRRLSGDNE
ncbi:MAG: aromatic ring-hydroxylating dioxygenase subunit alpha [Rhodospirillaceae bacterium]|nr:aromatic ring-hydroxylating dioxygenase subunit alpha [Rhodospirillaceae bacterium]